MAILGVTGAATAVASVDTGKRPDQLGKDEFLTLLIAQIKNQDPMNPMENADFTAQMAQFSSLEQLFNINDSLGLLNTSTAATNSAQVMNLIGKEVTAEGQGVHIKDGIASDISFALPDSADDVTIVVADQYGNVVKTLELGSMLTGEHSVEWDGVNDFGSPIPDGLYNFQVNAEDSEGDLMEVETFTKGIVNAVSFENGVAYLHIGNVKYMLGEVLEVSEPKETPADEEYQQDQETVFNLDA